MKKYLLILIIFNLPLHAEIITDGTFGIKTNLPGPNYLIDKSLGQQYGNNLFHSFQEFNLQYDEKATFSGPNNIQNVISRVTGGNPSSIDGLIQSTIPNADFYFLNPYGIMFGPNANLDIQGSFHASTADYLRLGENGKFLTSHPEQSILTVAEPQAFGFLDNPASIDIQGGFLFMPPEQTLSIIGGDINITDSVLFTPSGQINLVAIKEAEISLNNLQVNSFEKLGTITISQSSVKLLQEISLANIDVSGMPIPDMLPPNIGGQIFIRARQFVLNKGSIFADTYQGNGKNIDILANDLQLKNGAKITTYNYGDGQGGNVNITTEKTILTKINDEFDNHQYYNVNNIDIRNYNIIGTDTYKNGISGNINIDTNILEINHGIIASTVKQGGKSGNITINANNHTSLDNISIISTSTEENSSGNAGDIKLNTSNSHSK